MLKKDSFFKNYFTNVSNYNKNLKKTKKVFNSFLIDLKNFKIPLFESYEKDYEFEKVEETSLVDSNYNRKKLAKNDVYLYPQLTI